MPSKPPQTPWLPNSCFADQSLLVDAQPIFDDSTNDDSAWVGQSTILQDDLSSPSIISQACFDNNQEENELGLENFLPVLETRNEINRTTVRKAEINRATRGISELSSSALSIRSDETSLTSTTSSTSSRGTQKRERTLSSFGANTVKRARISKQGSDDFFHRRLSDSNRRTSLSTALPPLHEAFPTRQTSVSLTTASSSPSAKETKLEKAPNSLVFRDCLNIQSRGQDTNSSGCIRYRRRPPEDTLCNNPHKDSALSRYLAKSAVLAFRGITLPSDSKGTEDAQKEEDPTALQDYITYGERKGAYSKEMSKTDPDVIREPRRASISEKAVSSLSGFMAQAGLSEPGKEKNHESPPRETPEEQSCSAFTEDTNMNSTKASKHDESQEVKPSSHEGTITLRTNALSKPVPLSQVLHSRVPPRPLPGKQDKVCKQLVARNKSARAPLRPTIVQTNQLQAATSAQALKAKNKSNHLDRPTTTSAFASAALARLPLPGKGHMVAAEPVKVREMERKQDIAEIRGVFERLAPNPRAAFKNIHKAPSKIKSTHPYNFQPTVPLRGHTPGKSSALRAQKRHEFDQAVRRKMEEKERKEIEEKQKREEQEEIEYLQRRKETVIWAKPVPRMYKSEKHT
ncbi:hypothetical protein L204_101919 [Cryptococcus depauperatus]|nr:hypothetical protein L204_05569 [Cryptococcus depauperatus CBS 7855]